MDVADEGRDKNAFSTVMASSWKMCGNGPVWAVTFTVRREGFRFLRTGQPRRVSLDEDGLGAGVRGDARAINELRTLRVDRQYSPHRFEVVARY